MGIGHTYCALFGDLNHFNAICDVSDDGDNDAADNDDDADDNNVTGIDAEIISVCDVCGDHLQYNEFDDYVSGK